MVTSDVKMFFLYQFLQTGKKVYLRCLEKALIHFKLSYHILNCSNSAYVQTLWTYGIGKFA